MKTLHRLLAVVLILQFSLGPAFAQAFETFGPNSSTPTVSGISNLKIVDQSADGTEVTLNMDYTYDGIAGPTARIIAVMQKKGEKGISGWWGCDPAVVSKGTGPVSLRIRYFNDEFGVPPQFTSDSGRILFLNNSGVSVISTTPFLKTIKWGSPNTKPADKPAPTPVLTTRVDRETARKIAEEKRQAEGKALQEAKAREEARRQAEAEAKMRKEAEERAMAEARAREQARLKAEAEAQRLANEKAIAEAKAKQEADAREQARLAADAEAKRLADERRIAELKAKQEEEQRDKARLQAMAEARAREEARLKAEAEAKAREEARVKAEAETKRLAEEKRIADAKLAAEKAEAEKLRLAAEAKAREEARVKAEAETRRLADERRIAEVKAKKEAEEREQARLKAEAEAKVREEARLRADAEVKAREEARIKAETEAKRLAEEKRIAEAKAAAEAKAREEARLKAEADAKLAAEEKKAAEEKALSEATARKAAEEKAYQEALEQAKAEAEAKKAGQEKAIAEAASAAAPIVATAGPSLEITPGAKTKITNVDVVNRSIDRTQMTIGVEYDYNKDDAGPKALLGVDVLRQGEPQVAGFFKGQTLEVGKSRRNFVLFPVKFIPPSGVGMDAAGFSTDKVLVYVTNDSAKRLNLFAATMLLMWRAPGSAAAAAPVASATHSIDFDDFKQNDASDGYVAIRYNLATGRGKLRVAVYDAANPATRDYFATSQADVNPGRGLQTLEVKVEPESKSPTDFIRADTIEIEMIDHTGKVLAKTSKKANMTWSKPKQ